MAVYKVIQDIESEDKLLGPLGIRQFIYAAITVVCLFICFKLAITTGLGPVRWIIVSLFLMPAGVFGLLAAPLGGGQSTEVWLLARLNFFFKPQKRIWDQMGLKELVTITVPKREEKRFSDGLSQTEVHSRLHALATTLDSRGWAIKNVNVNMYSQPGYFSSEGGGSDRLVAADSLPQPVPTIEVKAEDDIMDSNSSVVAQHFDNLIHKQVEDQKQALTRKVEAAKINASRTNAQQPGPKDDPADFWFLNQVALGDSEQPVHRKNPIKSHKNEEIKPVEQMAVFDRNSVVTPGSNVAESELPQASSESQEDKKELSEIYQKREFNQHHGGFSHLKTLAPVSEEFKHQHIENPEPKPPEIADNKMTAENQAAIIELANKSDGLSVKTVAGLANHKLGGPKDDGMVEISLR